MTEDGGVVIITLLSYSYAVCLVIAGIKDLHCVQHIFTQVIMTRSEQTKGPWDAQDLFVIVSQVRKQHNLSRAQTV